jgi:RNA 2',3'-cyclic 3'-phosphodiesterase
MGNKAASESPRVFICIELPETVRTAIARVQADCRKTLAGGTLKWTKPEQFHLTLRFLGNIERRAVDELIAKVQPACARLAPLELRCARLGTFPERGRPRVLWVGATDSNNLLEQTFGAVVEATRGFGEEEAERDFTGHITLARCKHVNRAEWAQLREIVRRYAAAELGSWRATEIFAMRSELSSEGARHSVLERVALGGTGAARGVNSTSG